MTADVPRSLLARVPGELVGVVASDGRILAASSPAGLWTGQRLGDVEGSDARSYVHPDDLAASEKHWRQVVDEPGNRATWEVRIRSADDAWNWIEVSAVNALEDPDVEGVIVSCRDINETRRANEIVKANEQRFRAIVEHSRDVAALLDHGGHIVWCSPGITQMLGWSVDDLIGTSAFELVHPEDLIRAIERFAETIEPENPQPLTLRFAQADGAWRSIEIAGAQWPIPDEQVGLVVNLRDVEWRTAAERALRESESLFRSLADSSPTGIYRAMPNGDCVYVNERWQTITGYTADEAMGMGWQRMLHPDDRDVLQERQGYISDTHEPLHLEFRVLRPDGSTRWVSVDSAPMFGDGDEFIGTVGTLQDITARLTAQRDSARLTDIFEATQDIVAIADRSGKILYLNKSARQFFAISPTGGLDEFDLMSYFPPEMVERLATEVQPALEVDGMWHGEFALLRPDGSATPHSAQLLVHKDESGHAEFFSAILHDISERKAFEHRLAYQATHDPLTGLPNRTLLLDRLEMAVARARRHQRRLAVLFLDLDHFKVVNDSLGHGLGDRLLVAIASRLHSALRPDDTVARFGGDEFVVLCEDLLERDDATIIADRIHEALSGPFLVDDAEVFVGVSIGIAFPDDPDADPEALIRDADAAMYQAKVRGRARWVVFDNAMRASAVDRLDIENALRRALDRRELRVYYQPIIHLGTGRITGVEALLRWEHPERGLLLPGDFIGVAEETGLIVPIGTWVLNQACRQVQRWQAAVPELPTLTIAVNLSGRQLGHPTLVPDLAATLEETGIDPANVELEITESVLMDDVDMSEETLGQLKGLGVKLAVDDFGTGYSSLSYLRRFPVDLLKVDQSFVDGLGSEAEDSAIVTTIVTLAHNLGLEAVAEGVETVQQLVELRRLACDRAQGFLFARPAPGHDVGELLLHGERW